MQKSEEKFFYHIDAMNQRNEMDKAFENGMKAEGISIAAIVPALVIKKLMVGNEKFDQTIVTSCIGTCAAIACTGLGVSIYFTGKMLCHAIKEDLIVKKLTKKEDLLMKKLTKENED